MRVSSVISYTVAAGILVFLIAHTLGSPVGAKSESDAVPTTGIPEIVNDEAVSTVRIRGEVVEGRQEETEDEDDDDDATSAPAVLVVSTAAPVPKPQYNESTIQSELNFISQFPLGSNGSEALPQVPAQTPDAPPPAGSVPVPANPVETTAPPSDSVVESRSNGSSSASVAPGVSESPVVASSAAPAEEDSEDENEEDEATEAAPSVRQPEEEQENVPVAAASPPVALGSGASSPPVISTQAQTAAIGNAAVPKPAVKPVGNSAKAAAKPQEADGDNETDSETDGESENEINSDAVVTTGAPSTFETEYNYTVQFINDNNTARKQIIENDESEEGNSTVKPLNNKSTFESEYQHTSQFLSDADSRADCACGRIPYSVPLGDSSGINEYPWSVAIVRGGIFGGGRPHCGGTLVNDKYVITASHCMDGLYPSDIQVWMTVHSSFDSASSFGTTKVNVQEILMHPNYNRNTNDNDVALLKLSTPIDISQKNYFVPACIPAGNSDYAGVLARATAWSDGRRNQICKANMPVLSNSVCKRDTKHQDKITENMICAGYLTPNREETCIGDAGGPLLAPNGGRYTLIGLVSWGYRNSGQYSPTVYSRVSAYTDWILHNTRDADWCGN